jgi:hypothetical protein
MRPDEVSLISNGCSGPQQEPHSRSHAKPTYLHAVERWVEEGVEGDLPTVFTEA